MALTVAQLHNATDEQLLAAVVVGRKTRCGEKWELAKAGHSTLTEIRE